MAKAQADRNAERAVLTPARVLRIYGMRRSGNHAIINWLQRNVRGGRSVFLNNCRAGRDPIRTHRSLEVFAGGARVKFTDDMSLQDRFDAAGAQPTTLVSYEDSMPPSAQDAMPGLFADAPARETVVIIYRSFLNWSASLLQKLTGNPSYGPIGRARIMMNALGTYRVALERIADAAMRGFVAICYDRWHAEESYRAQVLKDLDFDMQDNSRGAVQRYGGGSSFQGKAAEVSDLQTDRRSEQMAEHPEFQTLLWTVSHDAVFMQTLAAHFPSDARRLLALAESAQLWINLPKSVPAA